MRKYCLIFLYFFLSSSIVWSQEVELEQKLIGIINEYRLGIGLQQLRQDEILTASAFDQAEYILKENKITHEQDNSKKKTLKDRLNFYQGLFYSAGENASIIGIGSKAVLALGQAKVTVENESMALEAAFTSWLKAEASRENVEGIDLYSVGAAVIVNEKKELIIVLVTASKAYQPPEAEAVPYNLYGLKEYKKEDCASFLEEHPTLPELFSDAIRVEKGEVFIQYHNIDYLKSILKDSKDKLGVELIRRSQFKCNDGNELFPGEVVDGYLLEPISKSALNFHNVDTTANGVKVRVGRTPPFYNRNSSELNLIFVKNGSVCTKSKHNKIESKNSAYVASKLLIEGKTQDSTYTWDDSLNYTYYPLVDKDWKNKLEAQLNFLEEVNLVSRKLELTYNDVALADETLGGYLEQLSEKYNFTDLVGTNSNALFLSKLQGTFYQFDIDEMTQEERKHYIQDKVRTDVAFRALVDSTMKVTLVVEGKASISKQQKTDELVNLYQKLVNSGRYRAALFLQQGLLAQFEEKKMPIPRIEFNQTQEELSLFNNAIVEASLLEKTSYDGNKLHLAFLELHLIDKKNPIIRFNYLNATVQYWKKNPFAISKPEQWLKEYKLLATSSIPSVSYFRTLLNYYLLMTDYYYEQGQFDKRKEVVLQMEKIYARAELKADEFLQFIHFLIYQDQIQMGVKALERSLEEKIVKTDLLLYLQIAQYGEKGIETSRYYTWLAEASEKYPRAFCELFQNHKMGIQSLKHKKVKEVYCSTCP